MKQGDIKGELENGVWFPANTAVFWGEIAPCDHVLQLYENDEVFLGLLEGFVVNGFQSGESVIIIANRQHLNALNQRLRNKGFDLFYLTLSDQYIPLDCSETLSQFMINDWPDEILFNHLISGVLSRAYKGHNQVRAFGEMVAELWAKGQSGATVRLEHLWNRLCESKPFKLFCAYPRSGFTQDANASLRNICCHHSKLITSGGLSGPDILYKSLEQRQAG